MNLIIPAAGKSTRFPGLRPKWMLVHPNGNMMVTEAIRNFNLQEVSRIFLVILQEQVEQYNCVAGIERAFENIGMRDKLKIVVLNKATRHQPETVARAIQQEHIEGPIFIKDSDNTFQCPLAPKNGVAVFDLNKMSLVNPSNKSYVTLDDNQMVNNIIEKQVISPFFCTGGYAFKSSAEYLKYYDILQQNENLYISHIIYKMLLDGIPFEPLFVSHYEDWGTLKDWDTYKSRYSTLFVDLDGVLVKNSGEYLEPRWGETAAIKENAEVVNELYASGKVRIIITTTRKNECRELTIKQLEREGIKYHDIIFDLYHSKRIVINDYTKSNPYKSCDAINLKRDSADLKEMLEDSLGLNKYWTIA